MCARPFACARPSGLGDLQETVVETVSSAPAPLELQGAAAREPAYGPSAGATRTLLRRLEWQTSLTLFAFPLAFAFFVLVAAAIAAFLCILDLLALVRQASDITRKFAERLHVVLV